MNEQKFIRERKPEGLGVCILHLRLSILEIYNFSK